MSQDNGIPPREDGCEKPGISLEVHLTLLPATEGEEGEYLPEWLKDVKPEMLDMPLEELDMAVSAYNCLKRAKRDRVGQFAGFSQYGLTQNLRNMNMRRAGYVAKALEEKLGIIMPETTPEEAWVISWKEALRKPPKKEAPEQAFFPKDFPEQDFPDLDW